MKDALSTPGVKDYPYLPRQREVKKNLNKQALLTFPSLLQLPHTLPCNILLGLCILHQRKESKVTQSCLTLCDPMDCSHGIFQGKGTRVGCHFLLQFFIKPSIKYIGLFLWVFISLWRLLCHMKLIKYICVLFLQFLYLSVYFSDLARDPKKVKENFFLLFTFNLWVMSLKFQCVLLETRIVVHWFSYFMDLFSK